MRTICVLTLVLYGSVLCAAAGTFETPTIIDTAYPVPPDAYFVAASGSDSAPGTEVAPFETVGHAIDVAPPNSTIVIRGGTYREPESEFFKPLTLQPYPHEQVWLKGSLVVTGWVADGPRWRKDGWTVEFDQDTYPPGATQPGFPHAGKPDMVFVDGDPLAQVGSVGEVGPGEFFADYGANRLYIGSDPTGRLVEAAAHPRALRANTGAAGTVIRGLGVMHYGGGRFEGALQCDNSATLFENNTVAWNAGKGTAIYNSTDAVVRGNTFLYNGQMGLAAWRADGLVVEYNRFAGNNQEQFIRGGDVAEAAGSKLTEIELLVVRDNIFEENLATGLWLDVSILDATVVGNVARNNSRSGLFFEISSAAVIASNVCTGNGTGILVSNAADVDVYNNTLVGNAEHLSVIDDSRVNGDPVITYVTDDVVIKNNILSDGDGGQEAFVFARDYNSSPIKDADDMIESIDHNAYHRSDAAVPASLFEWWRGTTRLLFSDLDAFRQSTGEESNGLVFDDVVPDPFFEDAAGGNYRLQATSPAIGAGDALPQDVADAIGVATGGPVDLGAFIGHSGADPPLSVPDGSAATEAMTVGRAGSQLIVEWDDRCAPFNVKLIAGSLPAVGNYSVTESDCSVDAPHLWDPVSTGDLWFLLVADNAFGVEGAWGESSSGERNGTTPSGTCGATVKEPAGRCLGFQPLATALHGNLQGLNGNLYPDLRGNVQSPLSRATKVPQRPRAVTLLGSPLRSGHLPESGILVGRGSPRTHRRAEHGQFLLQHRQIDRIPMVGPDLSKVNGLSSTPDRSDLAP